MDKKLPNVFHNKITKNINNNDNVYYGKGEREEKISIVDIKQKINEIFASPNYVYKANVEITLKDKTVTKRMIGRNKDYLITMDNELIPIDSIINIKTLKK